MTVVHSGGSALFTGTAIETGHTTHESVNVDEGAVHIDADDADQVLRIKHDKNDNVDILAAIDNTTGIKTAHINSAGTAYVSNVITATANLNDLSTGQLQASATDDGALSNLVKRDQANGTNIDNLHVIASATNYTNSFPPAGLYFTAGTCSQSLDLIADSNIAFQPYTSGGSPITTRTFAFGRAVPLVGESAAQADEKRDGLLIQDDAVDHSCEIMCSNALPTLRIVGTKAQVTSAGYTEPVCPVIEVQDGTGTVRYAVYDDGFVVQKGHQDTDPDALNSGHFHSVIAGDSSMYIGSCRLSYDRPNKTLLIRRLKEQVPVFLANKGVTGAPAGHTLASMSVHAWVAYARTHQSNERLQVQDVFPNANADWEAATIGTVNTRLGTLETEMDAAEGRLTTLEAGGSGVSEPPLRLTVYCDSEYAGENGTSNGSLLRPYTSLLSAMFAKLTQGATPNYTFYLQPGVYTGAIVVERTQPTQSWTIQGSGMDTTFVQSGTTFAAGGTSDVFKLKHFDDISIKDVTIRHGKYGAYVRNCRSVTLENVRFTLCGSDGTANRHDLTGSAAEQAAFWGSASSSNGGAARIQDSEQVHVTGCHVEHTLRGLRFQDCGSLDKASLVEGNRINRTLESGIYLASSSTGAKGSVNFKISGNMLSDTFNNGILSVGGAVNSIIGNTVSGSANAAIQLWHAVDTEVIGNLCRNCNRLAHNGIGSNPGDAHAIIDVVGDSAIRAGSYAAALHGNVLLQCGDGGDPNTNIGIRIYDQANRPASSAKVSLQGNHIDATTRIANTANLTEITTADASGGGGVVADLLLQSTTGSASLKIESNTDVSGGHSSLQLFSNSSNDGDDRHWKMNTDHGASDALVLTCDTVNFGTRECFRFNPAGAVSFGAGGSAITNLNVAGFQCREDAWFRDTLRTSGDIYLDANCTVRRSDANGDDLLGGSSGPTSFFYSGHNASYTLTAEHKDVMWTRHLTQNQEGGAITFVLPATPADGSDLHINIHSFQNHVTLDHVGGTIYLQKDNAHSFSPLSHDDPIVKAYTWNKIYLTATDRSSFSATLDGATGVWYVKAYADRRKIHHNTFTKHFDKTVNTHHTEATAFQLPKGYQRYEVSIGDGLVQGANDFHAYFYPPVTADLGTRIECLQLHPSHLNASGGLYVVNVANHDHILPGGSTATSPAYLSQSSSGRKRHVLVKTGATRWTQHRTM